jgi:hypothetical protein
LFSVEGSTTAAIFNLCLRRHDDVTFTDQSDHFVLLSFWWVIVEADEHVLQDTRARPTTFHVEVRFPKHHAKILTPFFRAQQTSSSIIIANTRNILFFHFSSTIYTPP